MKKIAAPKSVEHIVYLHGFGSYFDPDKPKIRVLSTVLPVSGTTVR